MVRHNAGLWAAVLVFLFGALFFVLSLSFDYFGPMGPGPGLLPLWLSGILMILSLVYIIESIRHVISWKDILPHGKGLMNILRISGAFLLLMLTVESIGFVLAGTVFLLILLFKEYKWYTSIAISTGVSLFLFWVFGDLLSIPLPVNAFGW